MTSYETVTLQDLPMWTLIQAIANYAKDGWEVVLCLPTQVTIGSTLYCAVLRRKQGG